jgi:hypothetical protein
MIFLFSLILNGVLCKLYSNINDTFSWSDFDVTNAMDYPFNVKHTNDSYQIIEDINTTHLKIRTNYIGGVLSGNPSLPFFSVHLRIIIELSTYKLFLTTQL